MAHIKAYCKKNKIVYAFRKDVIVMNLFGLKGKDIGIATGHEAKEMLRENA